MRRILLITALVFSTACAVDHISAGAHSDAAYPLDGGDTRELDMRVIQRDGGLDVLMDVGVVTDGGRTDTPVATRDTGAVVLDSGPPILDAGDDAPIVDAGNDAPAVDAGDDACLPVQWYLDRDEDGYGLTVMAACDRPGDRWVRLGGDCDDDDVTIHPGALELCDSIDNNCSGIDSGDVCDHECIALRYMEHRYLVCENGSSYRGALDRCEGYGGYLITFANDAERITAGAVTDSYSARPWWIGLNDRATEGTFVWEHPEPNSPFAYPWNDSNTNANDCVAMRGQGDHDAGHRWRRYACSSSRSYICEGL